MAAATFMTDIVEIITQAAEAAAGIGALYSGFKVIDRARDYYRLYDDQRRFYNAQFQKGAEAPLALEVFTQPAYAINYAGTRGEAWGRTGPIGGMSDVLGWWSRHSAVFGSSVSAAIMQDEYTQDVVLLETHWTNIMYRFEEQQFDILHDQRWDHRSKMHNIGLKQQSAVLSGLASGEGAIEGAISATGGYLAGVSNSLAEMRGYKAERDATRSMYAQAPKQITAYTPATTYPLGTNPASAGGFE